MTFWSSTGESYPKSAYGLNVSQDESDADAAGVHPSANRILAIFVAALLLVVVLVTVFSSRSATLELSPTTPAGTVQSYLRAVFASNNDQAAKFFAPESGCDAHNLDRAYLRDTTRVDLVRTELDGNQAQVWVIVEIASGSPWT